uniref:Uncharacterized protein n=1 Tax=Chaetoceros debilis TaxID=122233 RepID=A0A7S3VF82_9STRA
MLFLAKNSSEHALPIIVFVLQILILVLISIDLMQTYDRELITPMNIPVGVNWSVTVSQYIACIVSVFSADDLVYGVLHVGKHIRIGPRNCVPMNEPATSIKWEVSNFMRMVEGAIVIFASFIFIVQSSTAIDLWLNFAGVTFVGHLDDTAFALAKMNFLGNQQWKLANRVSDCRVHINHSRQTFERNVRIILFVGITVAMLAGLSVIVYKQDDLHFACKSITLTIGESTTPWIRHFSGTYILEKTRINGRAVYVQKQGTNGAFLAYCGSINQWTVSSYDDESRGNIDDPCYYFDLQSETTRTYDVAEIKTLRLPVRNGGVVIGWCIPYILWLD